MRQASRYAPSSDGVYNSKSLQQISIPNLEFDHPQLEKVD